MIVYLTVVDTNDVLKAQDAEGRGEESPERESSVLDKGKGPLCQKKKLLSFMNVTLIWIMRLSTLLGYMPIP